MNPLYIARIKSLGWRVLMMGFAAACAGILANLDTLHLTPNEVVLAGLVLGELSKLANDALKAQA